MVLQRPAVLPGIAGLPMLLILPCNVGGGFFRMPFVGFCKSMPTRNNESFLSYCGVRHSILMVLPVYTMLYLLGDGRCWPGIHTHEAPCDRESSSGRPLSSVRREAHSLCVTLFTVPFFDQRLVWSCVVFMVDTKSCMYVVREVPQECVVFTLKS